MAEHYFSHYSVLKKECIEHLTENAPPDSLFADLTFGAGGHSFGLLELGHRVIGFDQDPEAVEAGREKIKNSSFGERIELIHSNFFLFDQKVSPDLKFQGILMDLGVSSHQFDHGDRGFSFRKDAPLDMRMDTTQKLTAGDLVNGLKEEDLAKMIYEYGEERFSNKIAANIVKERKNKPILSTKALENIIFHSYPKAQRFRGINPSTRTFMALRIAVNNELKILDIIPKLLPRLNPGGRFLVISFHSLEDRIIKRTFKELEKGEIACKILTKKPITPSKKEIEENLRSRSAKLRVLERT
jgi:16S rRNA (cytosine1402-N4)-methyltransferase